MYLHSIATASPPIHYTQNTCWQAMHSGGLTQTLRPRSASLLEKILTSGNSGIDGRNLAADSVQDLFLEDAEALALRFEREAPRLAAQALTQALAQAGLHANSLDALFLCTCTGYLCPGVTSHVAESLGLREDIYLVDLVGLGCGAAIPMLRAVDAYARSHPSARVAAVAVEICSAAFFANNDPDVIISLCLFGDGAAATIWTGTPPANTPNPWRASSFTTTHRPEHREKIRFVNDAGKLKNRLHRAVPTLAAQAVADLYARRSRQPNRILAHGGGRDVIDALEAVLPMPLPETREILRQHGNMSSPSVLFALAHHLAQPLSASHQSLWLTSFGAGFAAHACELHREPTPIPTGPHNQPAGP
jgi:predicted naringenin-chalcone synthase